MRNLLCWLGIHRWVFLTKTGSPASTVGREGEANAAHEYRPADVVMAEWRQKCTASVEVGRERRRDDERDR
jgi:hypothetical protein